MKPNTKAILFSFLVFAIIFLLARTVLVYVFKLEHSLLVSAVSAVIASIGSPHRVVSHKQSGKHVALKWFFSKKIIRFKK